MALSDPRLVDLIHRWEAARERGQTLSAEQLCADCPELAVELQQRIDAVLADRTLGDSALARTVANAANSTPELGSLIVEMVLGGLRFHARGGLGAVYVAADQRLHRDIAVKFIHERLVGDPESKATFEREAEITGRLEHPGVVPVHGKGETPDGRPFYAMRFIQGESLDAAIRNHHQPDRPKLAGEKSVEFRNLLTRFVSVCQTIAYAHNRGILHRDIKPENIMLGKYGETLLVDWGLAMPVGRDEKARASGEKTLLPRSGSDSGDSSGSGAGTPAFMSPEQANGRLDLTPASDIYSLGSTLYKLLVGQAPYQGDHPLVILRAVREGRFPAPAQVKPTVPRALAAICLKAMSFQQGDRYRSALELAEDVQHWLADEPVAALPERKGEQLARWGRRHRRTVQAAVLGLAALLLVSVLAAVWNGALAERERAAREDSVRLAARFAARTVASEIDLRWRILELEARDAELRTLLLKAEQSTEEKAAREGLSNWVTRRFLKHDSTTQAGSWFISNRKGAIIALQSKDVPESVTKTVIGKNFAHRDYFHGLGKELEEGKTADVKPIDDVHRSTAFLSRHDQKLKVAFSVPVKDEERTIGVLAMSVELGRFGVLQTQLGGQQIAVLADSRSDWIAKEPRTGLLLHHPRLREIEGDPTGKLFRLDAAYVARLEKLRAQRLRQDSQAAPAPADRANALDLDLDYHDPAGQTDGGHWLAAIEPVLIRGRPEAIRDTGWVVIVQEKK